jgi:hypothetical protein
VILIFEQSPPKNEISKSVDLIEGKSIPACKVNDNTEPVTEKAVKVGVLVSLKVKSHAVAYSQPAKMSLVIT